MLPSPDCSRLHSSETLEMRFVFCAVLAVIFSALRRRFREKILRLIGLFDRQFPCLQRLMLKCKRNQIIASDV